MNLDFSQYVLVLAVIAGVTELTKRARAKDWWTVVTILTAAIVGGLFGLSGYYASLDVVEGVVLGFSASGALTILGSLGNKSTPAKSNVVKE